MNQDFRNKEGAGLQLTIECSCWLSASSSLLRRAKTICMADKVPPSIVPSTKIPDFSVVPSVKLGLRQSLQLKGNLIYTRGHHMHFLIFHACLHAHVWVYVHQGSNEW